MMQHDENNNWIPTKVFPCDCGMEGCTITVEEESWMGDCEGAPFIGVAFWEMEHKLDSVSGMSLWGRIKYAVHILRGKSPWTDMVLMRSDVAKNFANHILYLLGKENKKKKEEKIKPFDVNM